MAMVHSLKDKHTVLWIAQDNYQGHVSEMYRNVLFILSGIFLMKLLTSQGDSLWVMNMKTNQETDTLDVLLLSGQRWSTYISERFWKYLQHWF